MQRVQLGLRIFRQVDQIAAFDRLHDDHRLAVLHADLVAFAALHLRVVVIRVVELELHRLDRRILRQNLLQHLRAVVEGDADVANPALRLQRERRLIRAAGLEVAVVLRALRVHQVKIEIRHATGFELAFKQRPDVRLALKKAPRQFVRQHVAFPRIAARQAGLERLFALALKIAVRRIEVVEARLQKRIDHPSGFLKVHAFPVHRQAHAAKAEILLDVVHPVHPFKALFHGANPLLSYNLTSASSQALWVIFFARSCQKEKPPANGRGQNFREREIT